MKLKQTILSIAVTFLSVGAVTTTVDSSKYQQIEELQAKQEVKIKKAITSEFITPKERQILNTDMANFRRAEKTESRKKLLDLIDKEKENIKKIEKNLVKTEAETAKKELSELKNQYTTLEVQSKEAFVFKDDKSKVVEIKKEIDKLPKNIKKVQPIRSISFKIGELSASIRKIQIEAKSATDKLKELNNQSEELSEKNYLGSADRDTLEKDREKNNQLIKNSDSISTIETREKESKELIDKLSKKSDETEKDFKENEEDARKLSKSINTLLEEGELHSDEKEELSKLSKTLTKSLDLTEYKPGDLGKNYSTQKETYDKYEKNNLDRKAEKKKKEEEEKAAKEKVKKEEEEKKKRKEEASSNSVEWHKAPAGKRFLDKESQLTYKQVKNPSNFEEISEEEAAKYKPGHGNRSAKQ
ncbi:hypothetical protein [Vagococcus carniphilus]|uniref:Uncharacterized protein n=1 Tax=Vagococcus carniphilus TaxID=218144 RepID=A0A430B8A0_9ENTE|nr:hypothetical protein [Vagococcus carniphilus]QNN74127.1 hypothetical protein H9L18_05970 [Vagococcus carniphilus]RSU16566.1 hypothetical protein CBF28_03295 [Vagococcus carniphilus]